MMDVDDLDPVNRGKKLLVWVTDAIPVIGETYHIMDGKGAILCATASRDRAEFLAKLVNERYAEWLDRR